MEKPAPFPDSIIVFPCDVVGAGSTVESLARGYQKNTVCAAQYKAVMEGIQQYNEDIKRLGGKSD